MVKEKLGSGWDKEKDGKKYVSVALDLGVLGELSCAVFENTKRDATRNHPTHNLIHTPEGGKTQYVGAFWKKTGGNGSEYLMGNIKLKELGVLTLDGISVDFTKCEAPIDAKICRASAAVKGNGPQYHVFRTAEVAKPAPEGEEE